MDIRSVDGIIEKYQGKKTALISMLHDIQNQYHHLPEKALRRVAIRLKMDISDIYGDCLYIGEQTWPDGVTFRVALVLLLKDQVERAFDRKTRDEAVRIARDAQRRADNPNDKQIIGRFIQDLQDLPKK